MSSLNLPIIPTFRNIANLFECMAMFYFVKGLSLRIVTIPWKEKMLILLFVRFICVHLHQIKVV